ncbi:hypothetical protein ACTMU2_40485 [Cupriavidus basilensis]
MPIPARLRPWTLIAALLLGGCARVGPDFQMQREPWTESWSSAAIGQATQQREQPDLRQWWQIFGDPVLEALIAEADASNAGVRIAGLRVVEARAQLGIALAGRYPQVQQASAEALYVHSRQTAAHRADQPCVAVQRRAGRWLGTGLLGTIQPRHRIGGCGVLCLPGDP